MYRENEFSKDRIQNGHISRRTFAINAGGAGLLTAAACISPSIVLGEETIIAPPKFVRTPEERFNDLSDYPFTPHYHDWNGLRMHYLDAGSGPIVLMMHGQPTWSYLYRNYIPQLVKAGYRCIAPDYIGFGKSDKVVDDSWYVIERHCEAIRSLIDALDLHDTTLVAHDWGGPIGLRQVVDMPDRFNRLVIHNTWLHHDEMNYTAAIKRYRELVSQITPQTGLFTYWMGTEQKGYQAPFPDATYMAGIRRFPLCHPYSLPVDGNAVEQSRCFEELKKWSKPAHFIFGDKDRVFTPEWGQAWAKQIPNATFDTVSANHFPQETNSPEIVAILLERIKQEKT
ncbi:MAG: alpha/beta fold hydrolase [Pirellulaceae bacterium]|nr:alpha/beta fold hydrolase [Pirellulaceae bacterium]